LKSVVLDSYALISIFFDEPGAEEVEAILSAASSADSPLYISAVNWAETLYIVRRRQGQAGVDKASEFRHGIQLEIVPADSNRAELAASFKAENKISLADAFAAALAKEKKAELVTGDPEFKCVEKEIRIQWLK
jgi:predicted nucleic acid-binding protein